MKRSKDIVRQGFQRTVLLGKSHHWQAGKDILEIFSHPAHLHGEQYGRMGKHSLKVLQVVFQGWNHPPNKKTSFMAAL